MENDFCELSTRLRVLGCGQCIYGCSCQPCCRKLDVLQCHAVPCSSPRQLQAIDVPSDNETATLESFAKLFIRLVMKILQMLT